MKELNVLCNQFNKEHRGKGILCTTPNVGGTVNVVLGCVPLIQGVTEREAFYVIAAIRNYEKQQRR